MNTVEKHAVAGTVAAHTMGYYVKLKAKTTDGATWRNFVVYRKRNDTDLDTGN